MARLEQKQTLKQTLSPRQLLQARLLQLNSLSLESYILNELESNPVLESVDHESEMEEELVDEDNSLDMNPLDHEYEIIQPISEEKSLLDLPIPDKPDFMEILIKQLDDYSLSDLERTLCEEIIWNVDERGYLAVELSMIADRFDLREEDIYHLLDLVKNLDPKGIGSRNLKECLLAQLDCNSDSIPYLVIKECYEDFIHKRFENIQKTLKCNQDDLKKSLEQIGKLNPHPGEGKITGKERVVIPDIIIHRRDKKWIIRTNDRGIPELVISEMYKDLSAAKTVAEKDKKFLKKSIDKADMLIQAIHQRRHTLTAVMESIIFRQPKFFDGEINILEPMKLQDIADEISVDISTVSRSTRGKYVDTPFGVFELKSFFTGTVELKDGQIVSNKEAKQALKDLIELEDKKNPHTDEQILSLMKEKGYPLARRTIAKYRMQLNIPVARLRRII
jgi:RNA polymerase sigma-54 factor